MNAPVMSEICWGNSDWAGGRVTVLMNVLSRYYVKGVMPVGGRLDWSRQY